MPSWTSRYAIMDFKVCHHGLQGMLSWIVYLLESRLRDEKASTITVRGTVILKLFFCTVHTIQFRMYTSQHSTKQTYRQSVFHVLLLQYCYPGSFKSLNLFFFIPASLPKLLSISSSLESRLGGSITKCTNLKPSKNRFCSFLVQRYLLGSYSRIPNIFALGPIFWVLQGLSLIHI